ncbi:YqaA family protein [Falsirhodobacter sp. 1013]|uniref:YqaA family protein n=1 Tax=Falsirhodobacter sp. 1013 TaxID=3417566 RepID=UPI003EB79F0F
MTDLVTLAGLFGSAFLAATLIPAQSEALLFMLGRQGEIPAATLLVVASLGNILGSIVNWILGRSLHRYRDRRWFPMKPDQRARAEDWYRRWGWWTLLGSWLPVVGDPLTLIAGAMKEPFWRFLLVVSIAKAGRYAVVLSVA